VPRDWYEHYRNPANLDFTPMPLLVEVAEWMRPGRALDLACGAGRHAIYLARLGWQVTAVDASRVALGLLRRNAPDLPIEVHRADLEGGKFVIEAERYDLICDFFYLQRSLFPAIREGTRPGGVFAGALHLSGAFSLGPGDLRREFADWKILYYSEGGEPGRSRQTAKIIARKA
jgi:SAM-dependent methyltransferase